MELRIIVFNKEIIIQKLSSNKNIMNEIPKSGKTDCLTNKGEENSIFEKVTEYQNLSKKIFSIMGRALTRLTKTKITSTNN